MPLEWIEDRLWKLTQAAILLVLIGFVLPYRTTMSFTYFLLSRTGKLTTATIERSEGIARPQAVYSYTTADGLRRYGRDARLRGMPGDQVPVFYWSGEPEVSVPRNAWFELEQLAVAVFLAAACGTSFVSRRLRARAEQE